MQNVFADAHIYMLFDPALQQVGHLSNTESCSYIADFTVYTPFAQQVPRPIRFPIQLSGYLVNCVNLSHRPCFF